MIDAEELIRRKIERRKILMRKLAHAQDAEGIPLEELIELESLLSDEDRQRAANITPEILRHYGVRALAAVSEAQLYAFRYRQNIATNSDLYTALRIGRAREVLERA